MKKRLKSASDYPYMIRSRRTSVASRNAERVRFADAERNGETEHASKTNTPKTLEFAYFSNIKSGVAHGNSKSLLKRKGDFKSSKRNCNSKVSEKPEVSHPSPLCVHEEWKPYQQSIKEKTPDIEDRSQFNFENVTPAGQNLSLPFHYETSVPADCNLPCLGKSWSNKDIFSKKRERLHQWAYKSIPDFKNFHHDGMDLISALLSRLTAKENELYLFHSQNISKRETNNVCESSTSESENMKAFYLSHPGYSVKKFSEILSGRFNERVISEQDNVFSGFNNPKHGMETHFQDEFMDLNYSSRSHKLRTAYTNHGLSSCLPFEEHGSSGFYHVKELSKFSSPIKEAKESHRFLLEWDFKRDKDRDESMIDNHEPANILSSALATWNCSHLKPVDSMVEAKDLCSSSLFSDYHRGFDTFPIHSSNISFVRDFDKSFEDQNTAELENDRLSLALPSITEYMIQDLFDNKTRDFKPSHNLQLNFAESPEGPTFHSWGFPLIDDSLYSFSGLEESPGKGFIPFSPWMFPTDNLHFNVRSSVGRLTTLPLLLDNVSYYSSDEKLNFNEDDEL